jgi:transposase InsO family protein
MVDQYSSFKFVWFLKAKSDAYKEFEKHVPGQKSIKELLSDQGGTFFNERFSDFASRKGIL